MSEAAVKPERPKARQVSDPELIAMHEIVEVLADLDADTGRRVVRWVVARWDELDTPFTVE